MQATKAAVARRGMGDHERAHAHAHAHAVSSGERSLLAASTERYSSLEEALLALGRRGGQGGERVRGGWCAAADLLALGRQLGIQLEQGVAQGTEEEVHNSDRKTLLRRWLARARTALSAGVGGFCLPRRQAPPVVASLCAAVSALPACACPSASACGLTC